MSDPLNWIMGGTAVAVVALIVGLLVAFSAAKADCTTRGGELISVYKGVLCVSPDGRILR